MQINSISIPKFNSINSNNRTQTTYRKQQPMTDTVNLTRGVSFGAQIKLNTKDAIEGYEKLFGVKVEKIADDSNTINFESVESYSLNKAKEICDNARQKFGQMREDLKTKYTKAESVPEFSAKLHEYIQMGGGEDTTFRTHPAGVLASIDALQEATPSKVSVPIIIHQCKGIGSCEVGAIKDLNPDFHKVVNTLMDSSSHPNNAIITEYNGQKYSLTAKNGYKGMVYSSEKL